MKTILITGASGFVGKRLSHLFLLKGDQVIGLGTSDGHPFTQSFENFKWVSADTTMEGEWQNYVSKADIIINLAGRSIFKYWTKKYKQAIYESRILTTLNVVNALDDQKQQLLLSTSAVGIYGDGEDELMTEDTPPGKGFLSSVCVDWEKEAKKANAKNTRVAIMRFGVVLWKGGALSKMIPAFKFFAGGPLGNGQHWFPWIHIKDLENAVEHIIENKSLEGVFNFTSPEPVRQKQFARVLGKRLNRPSFMPAPAFMLKIIMGELGSALLESQKAIPKHLEAADFTFLFPDVDSALKDIIEK